MNDMYEWFFYNFIGIKYRLNNVKVYKVLGSYKQNAFVNENSDVLKCKQVPKINYFYDLSWKCKDIFTNMRDFVLFFPKEGKLLK